MGKTFSANPKRTDAASLPTMYDHADEIHPVTTQPDRQMSKVVAQGNDLGADARIGFRPPLKNAAGNKQGARQVYDDDKQ